MVVTTKHIFNPTEAVLKNLQYPFNIPAYTAYPISDFILIKLAKLINLFNKLTFFKILRKACYTSKSYE